MAVLSTVYTYDPEYPVAVIEPEPILNSITLVPFVLTPLSMMVIRFTQDGMLVKSMLVPLVDATAVPLTIFCVDDHTDPSAVNRTLPAVVGAAIP